MYSIIFTSYSWTYSGWFSKTGTPRSQSSSYLSVSWRSSCAQASPRWMSSPDQWLWRLQGGSGKMNGSAVYMYCVSWYVCVYIYTNMYLCMMISSIYLSVCLSIYLSMYLSKFKNNIPVLRTRTWLEKEVDNWITDHHSEANLRQLLMAPKYQQTCLARLHMGERSPRDPTSMVGQLWQLCAWNVDV